MNFTQDKITKIAEILNLSTVKNRTNTIGSLVENILFSYNEELSTDEIISLVTDIFGINLFKGEVEEALNSSVGDGFIIISNNKYILSEDKHSAIQRLQIENKTNEQNRFDRFNKLVTGIEPVNDGELELLWKNFNDYLIECFYQYGENAVKLFKIDKTEITDKLIDETPFKNTIVKLHTENLKKIFKKIVINFASKLSTEDLDYLESLARKTLSFYSLGLPKELHEDITSLELIDWVIFVDTNFLYSILNLHSHPENAACNELLTLQKKYNLKLDFRFIPGTLRELRLKKNDFEESIPKTKYTTAHINAMLSSERLDSYSKAYYERLLVNSEILHPTEIIDSAERTLVNIKGIKYHNSKFENLNEKYIDNKTTEYYSYIEEINKMREEKGLPIRYKSFDQLKHDVFLREVIDTLRFKETRHKPTTFSEISHLGLTLDKSLIQFDRRELSRVSKDYVIPNFFLPSYILSKLYRLIPVQTKDYKQAFITAIATFSFSEGLPKSKDVQRFVNYYKEQGLNDEKLLLSFITDDIFLRDYNSVDSDSSKEEFVESEINKKIQKIKKDADIIESKLSNKLTTTTTKLEESEQEKAKIYSELKAKEQILEESKQIQKLYLIELQKLRDKKNPIVIEKQISLDIEFKNNELKEENEKLKRQLLEKQQEKMDIKPEEVVSTTLSWTPNWLKPIVPIIFILGVLYWLYVKNIALQPEPQSTTSSVSGRITIDSKVPKPNAIKNLTIRNMPNVNPAHLDDGGKFTFNGVTIPRNKRLCVMVTFNDGTPIPTEELTIGEMNKETNTCYLDDLAVESPKPAKGKEPAKTWVIKKITINGDGNKVENVKQ